MASFNKVILMGNLTRDTELRYTSGGTAICTFGLAMNRRYTTGQGEQREEVCFVDIEVWGRQAETADQYLRKGAPALIEGRLRLDQWEDRESGQKRSKLLVRAEQVQFLGSPQSFSGQQPQPQGQPQPRPQQSYQPPRQQQQPYQSQPRQQPPYQAAPPQDQAAPPPMPPFEPIDEIDDNIPF